MPRRPGDVGLYLRIGTLDPFEELDVVALAQLHAGLLPRRAVALEAAACGVPAIAGRSGGSHEAVADGDTGLVVPPRDVESVRQALERLLSDDELRGKSVEFRERLANGATLDDLLIEAFAVTREAAFRYQKALEDAEQERRAVERATRAAYDGAVSGVSLAQALKQSVISQESAVEAKDTGYRSGLFTILPVLDAQRDLYLARRDYAQSRYDYLFNRLKLKQAAGTLSETDLVGVGAALQ